MEFWFFFSEIIYRNALLPPQWIVLFIIFFPEEWEKVMEIQWVKTVDYTNRSDCMFVCKCKRVSKFRTFWAVVKTILSLSLSLTHSLFNWRKWCLEIFPPNYVEWNFSIRYLFIFKWHFSTTALILLPSGRPVHEHFHLLCLILRSHFVVSETWIQFGGDEECNFMQCFVLELKIAAGQLSILF